MRYCRFILSLLVLSALAAGFFWRKPLKDAFLTTNGGFVRWFLQKRSCNRVYLIEPDMGYTPIKGAFPQPVANQVVKAYGHAQKFGKKFLYVQGPDKVSLDRRNLQGVFSKDENCDNCDTMLKVLAESDVPVIDLRPVICPDSDAVRRNFMKTDTHWNYDGVLCAFRYLAPILCDKLGKGDCDIEERLSDDLWVRKDFPRKVLGSVGRRVGPWFLPMEDYHYYLPTFKNTYTIRGKRPWEKQERKVKGDFSKVFVVGKTLNKPASVYKDSPYFIVGGGKYDWLEIHNEDAPCKAKVLFVADSFGLVLSMVLSTVISDLRVVDYRTYKQKTIKNEIKDWRPAMVVVFASGRIMQDMPFWNFYCEKWFR